MRNHYRNTVSLGYLLLCLFITSATAHSFIRQPTDALNTYPQKENEARPNRIPEEVDYFHNNQEISSRDSKLSASSTVKGLRSHRPTSYIIKMEAINTLYKSPYREKYVSRPFSVGGYNWTLVVYPDGNVKDSGSGYLSLYVAIEKSSLSATHQEVYADLRFYIFNNNERKYFTIQDTDVWRFTPFKTMWGFSQVLSVGAFKNASNGYLYDGNHCEFGVDVTIASPSEKSELFSAPEKIYNPKYTWAISKFSTLLAKYYVSDAFTIGGRSWYIKVYPNGENEDGEALSMYLMVNGTLAPYEKTYARFKLRVLNQRQYNNIEKQINSWYMGLGYGEEDASTGWGYAKFVSLSELRDSSKGFLVNDVLKVQVEMEAITSTTYFPS